jgi:hypothetical protein
MLAAGLTRALERAGVPIFGVSIGQVMDRSTWRIDFQPSATSAQRADAALILSTYDLALDAVLATEDSERSFDGMKLLKAVAISALWGRLGRQPTPAEIGAERTRVLNVYRAL